MFFRPVTVGQSSLLSNVSAALQTSGLLLCLSCAASNAQTVTGPVPVGDVPEAVAVNRIQL